FQLLAANTWLLVSSTTHIRKNILVLEFRKHMTSMNKNILNDLLNTQGHINEEELNAYLSERAPSEVRHKIENFMLDNDLFSDAVEGYQEMGMTEVPALENFSEFKKKLPALDGGAKIIQLTPAQ